MPTLETALGPISRPLIFLRYGGGGAVANLREAAYASGGAEIDVAREPVKEALKKLSVLPARIIGVSGTALAEAHYDRRPMAAGQAVRVLGRLKSGGGGEIELIYGAGNMELFRRKIPCPAVGGNGFIRRLWAQAVLADLESAAQPDRRAIIEHCKANALVSDETSLIVLERFEDYLTYEIPPPEADLRVKYQAALEKKQWSLSWYLADSWRHRLRLNARKFPREEYEILPRLRQVAIWTNAFETAFAPDTGKLSSYGVIADWQRRALALIDRRGRLQSAAEFEAWKGELAQVGEQGGKLSETEIKPAAGPVSVRGEVREPATMQVAEGTTLTGAIRQAGGSWRPGKPGVVALYRNAGKVVYNTRSPAFQDVKLLPGDMVVVENEFSSFGCFGGADPFAAPQAGPEGPAVVRQADDLWLYNGWEHVSNSYAEPFGGTAADNPATEVRRAVADEDAVIQYRQLAKGGGFPLKFYIDNARILFKSGHAEMGRRVLSTIVERGHGEMSSQLAYVFWLVEFGQTEEAARVLARIEPGAVETLLAAELCQSDEQRIALLAERLKKGGGGGGGDLLLLTELSQLKPERHPLGADFAGRMKSDLRITIASEFSKERLQVEVIDPTGEVISQPDIFSATGSYLSISPGVVELIVGRVLPGVYKIRFTGGEDTSLRIAVHTMTGGELKTVRMTKRVEAGKTEEVAGVEFPFVPGGN